MNWVTRKPSLGAGKFSKSINGACSFTALRSLMRSRTVAEALSKATLAGSSVTHREPVPLAT